MSAEAGAPRSGDARQANAVSDRRIDAGIGTAMAEAAA